MRRKGGAEKEVLIIERAKGRECARRAAVRARLAVSRGMAVDGLSCFGAEYVSVVDLGSVEAMGLVR